MGHTARLPNPWTVPVVTIAVAADLLGIDRSNAYRAAKRGDLPTIRLNGGIRVPVAGLYAMLRLPLPTRPASPIVDR